jgi:hypothetical protein
LENKNFAAEFGPSKEKDIDFSLGMAQLEGTTMAAARVEHEVYRRDGDVTSFPTMGKFESTSQDTTLDIGREWSEIVEWPEWEDDGILNKDNGYTLLSEHDFGLPLPSSKSPVIQPNANEIGNTKETLKHHSRNDSFGHDDANISLNMMFPGQVGNNSSLHYKTPQFGFCGNLAGSEDIQEEAPTAIALDMIPQPSKCGEQKDSGMLPEINISDTFTEHPSSTDRDHDDQPAAPSALPSLPTRPTTPGG